MQIKTTSHDSEIAVGNGVYTVEYTFSTGESIVKVRMIANVSFREMLFCQVGCLCQAFLGIYSIQHVLFLKCGQEELENI